MRHLRLQLLPRHARGQHRQRVAQIDHVIKPQAKEVLRGRAAHHAKTPGNQAFKTQIPGEILPGKRVKTHYKSYGYVIFLG
jgi:hypothetical protein